MKLHGKFIFSSLLMAIALLACAKSDGGSNDSASGSGGGSGGGGSTPAAPTFTDNLNGTIAASATTTTNGLTWMKCSVGQTYNVGPNTCTGTPLTNILYCSANDQSCNNSSTYLLNGTGTSAAYTSCNNLNSTPPGGFAGKTTWRVPTKEELRSLVVCSNGPATPVADNTTCTAGSTNPAMNTSVFPANSSVSGKAHWSATTYSAFVANAFTTTFTCLAACLGSTGAGNNKATGLSLRCVAD